MEWRRLMGWIFLINVFVQPISSPTVIRAQRSTRHLGRSSSVTNCEVCLCLNTHSCCIQFFVNIPLIYNQDTFPFHSSLHLPKDKCSNDPLSDDGSLLCQFYKTTQSNHWQQIDFIPSTNPNWFVMSAGGHGWARILRPHWDLLAKSTVQCLPQVKRRGQVTNTPCIYHPYTILMFPLLNATPLLLFFKTYCHETSSLPKA